MDTELTTNNTENKEQAQSDLDETTFENISSAILQLVSLLGNTVPLVGAVSGLFLQEISGRRLKRFKLYIEVLNNKYENLEKLCHSHDTRLNLVEEGVYHAIRAYSEERIKHNAENFGRIRRRSDEATIQETAKQQLIRLGLLRPIFKKPCKGEFPEFDTKTGMIKASGYNLTWIGSMFLRYLGLAEPGEL